MKKALLHVDFYIEDNCIRKVQLSKHNKPLINNGLPLSFAVHFLNSQPCHALASKIEEWMERYTLHRGRGVPDLPLFMKGLSPFTTKALNALKKTPFGSIISYKELAALSASPNGARAAGTACGKNPFPLIVPCHRVIASDGSIGGFSQGESLSQGLEIKRALLEFEGMDLA